MRKAAEVVNRNSPTVVLLLPSLKTSGGVREAVRLAKELRENGNDMRIVCMWSDPVAERVDGIPITTLLPTIPAKRDAWKDLPRIAWRLWRHLRSMRHKNGQRGYSLFATHFSTLPFQYFVPPCRRYVFVQDLEWSFIGGRLPQNLLKQVILFFYRRAFLVTANSYLTENFRRLGLNPGTEASIWASPSFLDNEPRETSRSFDYVMVLRRGAHKRLDLYKKLLRRVHAQGQIKTICITPDDSIAADVMEWSDRVLLRPPIEEMKRAYIDSKVFLLLSEHEGFALPPLEAMGSGCIPVCRECGGVSAYMRGPLADNVLPLSADLEAFEKFASGLCANSGRRQALSVAAFAAFDSGLQESVENRTASIELLTRLFGGRN